MTTGNVHYAATIGSFDGVHLGHRYLIAQLQQLAEQEGLMPLIVTFNRHPLQVLNPAKCPGMLTTFEDRVALLSDGCEVVTLDFDAVKGLTAKEFIEYLASNKVRVVMIGHDNRFGSDRLTTIEQFEEAARGTGVKVVKAERLDSPGVSPYSSTHVRRSLSEGDVEMYRRLTGRFYRIVGKVVDGKHLGRQLGFPTANIEPLNAELALPADGVYSAIARFDGEKYAAMVNVGATPTVDESGARRTIEAHLLDMSGDLYGKTVTLQLVSRLRATRRFDTLEDLKSQLERDREATRRQIDVTGEAN